jgi:predicted RNase H-like HicB family nuclease
MTSYQPTDTLPASEFTAVIKRDGAWWIGWIEEVPGVNAQETTQDALIESLKVALQEAIDMNRADARRSAGTDYTEVKIAL